jgi:hypothetical protein
MPISASVFESSKREAEPVLQVADGERGLEVRQAVAGRGQKDDHVETLTVVGQAEHPNEIRLAVIEVSGQAHHVDKGGRASGDVEVNPARAVRVELDPPGPFEVDGIDEHEHRGRVDLALLEQLLDPVGGLLSRPVVDLQTRGFGRAPEVHGLEAARVVSVDRLEVGREKRLAGLAPEPVGDRERGLVAAERQRLRELSERGVQPVLAELEVKRLGHLLGRLGAGPGIGHRQGGRDALGGAEDVALALGAELGVKIDGELRVAPDQGRLVGGLTGCGGGGDGG